MRYLQIHVLLLLIVSFILRIWRMDELFYFMMDEAYLAFRGWGLFHLGRFFIIGAASPLGFHLPPYFFWFAGLFLPITNYYPVIWGVVGAILSTVTIFLLYKLISIIFNPKMAFISALLYSFSSAVFYYDRHFWMLSLNPLFTIVTLLLLMHNYKIKWVMLAVILVFAITCDPTNLTLLLLVLHDLFSKNINYKNRLVFVITFLALFITPLLIFDIRHQGSNIAGLSKFFNRVNNSLITIQNLEDALLLVPRTLNLFWFNFQNNVAYFHTYCNYYSNLRQEYHPLVLQLFSIFLIFYFIINKVKSRSKESYLARLLVIYLLGILIYGGLFSRPIYDHYIIGLLPVFAYLTAKLILRFWVIGFFILVIFLSLNLYNIFKSTNPYGLKKTLESVKWLKVRINGNFAFDSISKCFRYNGIRYLMEINDLSPHISFIDPEFFWLYAQKPSKTFPNKVVLYTDQPVNINLPILDTSSFGAWRVFILDNTNGNYKIEGL